VFVFQDARGPVEVAFTDRHAGTAAGASTSLDLASPGGAGEADHVTALARLDLLARAVARGGEQPDDPWGLPPGTQAPVVVRMRQVHGAGVAVVDEAVLRSGEPPVADAPVADALVTRVAGVVLLVRVADCVPLLLADPEAGVVAAVHAGRPGLVAGVVPAAVRAMRDLGASRVLGWVGPHVCGGCYEVPARMRAEVSAVVAKAWAQTSWGTPSVDIGAGVLAQLGEHGVDAVDASRCTVEDEDLFSYRRQGAAAGRLGGLVWLRP
jgi:YfiH family protein